MLEGSARGHSRERQDVAQEVSAAPFKDLPKPLKESTPGVEKLRLLLAAQRQWVQLPRARALGAMLFRASWVSSSSE